MVGARFATKGRFNPRNIIDLGRQSAKQSKEKQDEWQEMFNISTRKQHKPHFNPYLAKHACFTHTGKIAA
jgi:hypothetical protein